LKNNHKGLLFYIVIFVALVVVLTMLYDSQIPTADALTYKKVMEDFRENRVDSFLLDDTTLKYTVVGEEKIRNYEVAYPSMFYTEFMEIQKGFEEDGIESAIVDYDYRPAADNWWLSLIPYAIMIILFVVMFFFLMNQSGGGSKTMNFGKAKAKVGVDMKSKITFKDVAGADEEKEELSEIVDFLRSPKKYADIGARVPKGVLLVGPPGTGKTYMAKAVAGEAGVPFLSISGSDFVEMFVGVGASRVRDLFDQAKRNAPAIIFIDEIDAVGRQRGAGLGGGHDEREQTLNQLLVEMDGFAQNEGVIIIAATNRPDILDSALLRPGRFDRQIYIGLPDIKAREEILKVHSVKKPLAPEVQLEVLAKSTGGFSPADLENLLNEGALLAARRQSKVITMEDLSEAMIKVIAGPEKKSRVISDREKKITAYHEAGHAVASHFLETHDPVHQISIIQRGRAGGYTLSLPTEDKHYSTKKEMLDEIVSLLGGRVAEALVLGDISTGASNDISRATDIARKMITKYGMSEKLGPIVYGSEHDSVFLGRDFTSTPNYSDAVAAEIDQEIRAVIDEAYAHCEAILKEHSDKLEAVSLFLLEHEKMEADEFLRVMNGEEASPVESPADPEAPTEE